MTPRDRVALVGGISLIVLILAGGRGLPRAAEWHRATLDEVALRARAVRGLQERLATASSLSDSLAYLEGAVSALPDRLLRGGSHDDAQLDLIRRVNAASLDSTMALDSLRMVDPASATDSLGGAAGVSGPVAAVMGRAWATSDLEGITAFVGRLEGDPALWVERFSIRLGEADPSDAETLSAELQVAGWRLVPP